MRSIHFLVAAIAIGTITPLGAAAPSPFPPSLTIVAESTFEIIGLLDTAAASNEVLAQSTVDGIVKRLGAIASVSQTAYAAYCELTPVQVKNFTACLMDLAEGKARPDAFPLLGLLNVISPTFLDSPALPGDAPAFEDRFSDSACLLAAERALLLEINQLQKRTDHGVIGADNRTVEKEGKHWKAIHAAFTKIKTPETFSWNYEFLAFPRENRELTRGGLKNSFVVGLGGAPQNLDPALAETNADMQVAMALFEGLTIYDPASAKVLPGLAESWSVSPDGLTYTFKLRKASWSDGTPITAQQVVDSWIRTLDPATGSSYAYLLGMVVQGADAFNNGSGPRGAVAIKATGPSTFVMTLFAPSPWVLGMLAHPAFAVVPGHAISRYGPSWAQAGTLVSNGPFVLKEWVLGDHITVVKNQAYWDAANVRLGGIKFLTTDDGAALYAMMKTGDIDWDGLPPPDPESQLKLRRDYQATPQLATYYYIFNAAEPPFDNVKVRKAFTMAINRDELVAAITQGGEIPADAIVPPLPGYTPATGNPYNPEAAKALLAEAGYPGGAGFPKLTLIYNTSERHRIIGEWIQQQLKAKLGIDIKLQNIEWKTFLDLRNKHDFTLARAGWVGDYLDPTTFLEMFVTGNGNNNGAYGNPAYDELIARAATQSGEGRMATLKAAEAILLTQDQAIMPLYYYVNRDLIDLSKWGGWAANALGLHQLKFVYRK